MKLSTCFILLLFAISLGCDESEIDFSNVRLTEIDQYVFRGELMGSSELIVCYRAGDHGNSECQYGFYLPPDEPERTQYDFAWFSDKFGYLELRIDLFDSDPKALEELFTVGEKEFAPATGEVTGYRVYYRHSVEDGALLSSDGPQDNNMINIVKSKQVEVTNSVEQRLWLTLSCNLYTETGELAGRIDNAEMAIVFARIEN